MDKPFLTAVNTRGETLQKMRKHQQILIYSVYGLGGREGGREGRGREGRTNTLLKSCLGFVSENSVF